ncbi:hypothetical protein [Sphingomonas sp.]|uniref:hypothetical protein n=1 Tax=Sphingomonas sp. TaxID=28214 RepID=UPI002B5FB35C|nr:hypothetical protein [Sphingomonas sp.]HTG37661.1 hypothetical protein [Sphingomonas sp.]
MIAIGCLLLIVLPMIGLTLGGLLAGLPGVKWGAAIGLAIAVGFAAFAGYGLIQIGRRR